MFRAKWRLKVGRSVICKYFNHCLIDDLVSLTRLWPTSGSYLKFLLWRAALFPSCVAVLWSQSLHRCVSGPAACLRGHQGPDISPPNPLRRKSADTQYLTRKTCLMTLWSLWKKWSQREAFCQMSSKSFLTDQQSLEPSSLTMVNSWTKRQGDLPRLTVS